MRAPPPILLFPIVVLVLLLRYLEVLEPAPGAVPGKVRPDPAGPAEMKPRPPARPLVAPGR